MSILTQLGIDQTAYVQFAIFVGLYLILSQTFFKPYMKLFEARRKATVEDREHAKKLLEEADQKIKEYQSKIHEIRAESQKQIDLAITAARKEESQLLLNARDEAKKIYQDTLGDVTGQKEKIKKEIIAEIDTMAKGVSEKLLLRKI